MIRSIETGNYANLTLNVRFADMIERQLLKELTDALQWSSSVVLVGPRQVGKTTLATQLLNQQAAVYLDLEDTVDLSKVKDIKLFHQHHPNKLIILDEVQRLPEVFAQLRGIIDKERRKGKKSGLFLFLGSASLELLQQSSESLAGRIAYLELFPINELEFAQGSIEKCNELWIRGGFPESLLAATPMNSLKWRRDFIKTYLERDIPLLGPRIPAETLQRFWTMLAHHQGGVVNMSNLGRNLDLTGVTISRYLDLLVDLLLVRRLQPWTFNAGKRLVRSPKVYVRDSGIVHALLNIPDLETLLGHPVVGGSWEGFVIENIFSVLPSNVQAFYYGTPGGAEIDLLLEFSAKEVWAIEIKRKSAPVVPKGFQLACEEVGATKRFILYSGSEEFPLTKDTVAIGLHHFLTLLKNK